MYLYFNYVGWLLCKWGLKSKTQGNHIYQTSPAMCNRTLYSTLYLLNLSPINAKLTLLSYVYASVCICFCVNVHRYHGNCYNGDVRWGNFSDQSSNFSVSLL